MRLALYGLVLALAVTPVEAGKPDTAGILRLMGRFVAAHACPIEPDVILTNAHVADVLPFEADFPAMPYRYSDGYGNTGVLVPNSIERCSDLARMTISHGAVRPYKRAEKAPEIGETLYFIGYDYSSKKKAYAERPFTANVVRIVAGTVILDQPGKPGSSGSCVLNDRDEVVAINAWGSTLENGQEIEGVIGVWGPWLESCR